MILRKAQCLTVGTRIVLTTAPFGNGTRPEQAVCEVTAVRRIGTEAKVELNLEKDLYGNLIVQLEWDDLVELVP